MITQKIIARTDSLKLDKIISRYGEDSMRQVVFIIVRPDPDSEELIPITIPEDAVGSFRILKPSGNFVIVPMSKSVLATGETAFYVVLPASANTAKGSGYYDIRITSETDKYYFTAQGDFLIDDNIISDEVLEDVSEVNGLIFPDDFLTVEDHVAIIDDETVSTETTWSSDKISDEIDAHAGGDVSKTVSGNPITFTDGADAPLVKCVTQITGYQQGSGTPSPDNIRPIVAYTEGKIEVSDGDGNTTTHTTTFSNSIYQGNADFVNGEATGNMTILDLSTITDWHIVTYDSKTLVRTVIPDIKASGLNIICSHLFRDPDSGTSFINGAFRNRYGNFYNFEVMIEGIESQNDMNTWLLAQKNSGNPVLLAMETITPTIESVTPTNLPIKSLSGYNHIESSTGEMEVEYITEDFQPIAELINRNAPVYSTSEHPVATWIDGSIIYEKTYDIGYLTSGNKAIAHEINGMGHIIQIQGYVTNNTYDFPLPYATTDSASCIGVTVNRTNINIYSHDRSDYHGYVTIQYTKI